MTLTFYPSTFTSRLLSNSENVHWEARNVQVTSCRLYITQVVDEGKEAHRPSRRRDHRIMRFFFFATSTPPPLPYVFRFSVSSWTLSLSFSQLNGSSPGYSPLLVDKQQQQEPSKSGNTPPPPCLLVPSILLYAAIPLRHPLFVFRETEILFCDL